jgi:pimeloyl-ACP methyl ester carboxylesterase
MDEQFCTVGEITLCYEEFGNPGDEPLLLIMGLGAPMTAWPEPLIEDLVEQGFRVIRFDNRDAGHSTVLSSAGVPTTAATLAGRKSAARYTLSDLAGDAAGLLDQLGIAEAHVVGASMGGMIAQTLAIERPSRVRTLASIMSTTGRKTVGTPHPRVMRQLVKPPPASGGIEAEIEHFVEFFRSVGSRGDLFDEAALRETARIALERGSPRSGTLRQLAAVTSSPDRTRMLRRLRLPTLVVHGSADRLITPSGGRATAKAIPGSSYLELSGMGHDFPAAYLPLIASAVVANARRAAVLTAA